MAQLPLHALRVFEAVVRKGSFRGAADVLCLTPSAVSHQIRHLEDWLGRPLFARGSGPPRLLADAEPLARSLALALAEIDAACARLRAPLPGRPLTVAAIASVAVCWLIPRLGGFRAAHPDIELRVIYARLGEDIDFDAVDLALVYAPSGWPDVWAEPFLPGLSVPVCSPDLASECSTAAQILARGLLHDTDASTWRRWFDRAGLASPARLAGPVYEDFTLLRAAALAGQGVALCPRALVADDLAGRHLVQVSDIAVAEGSGYYLRAAPDRVSRPEAERFRLWALAAREAPTPEP